MKVGSFINAAAKAIVGGLSSGVVAMTVYVQNTDVQLDQWEPWLVGAGTAFGNGVITYFVANTDKPA